MSLKMFGLCTRIDIYNTDSILFLVGIHQCFHCTANDYQKKCRPTASEPSKTIRGFLLLYPEVVTESLSKVYLCGNCLETTNQTIQCPKLGPAHPQLVY